MNTGQENFDDILRSKLSEDKFEFNEANWDKAEALIIKADKKRKRRRIGFIFFIGLVLGVCLMIPFIGTKKESLTNGDKKVNTKKNDVSIENNTKNENEETSKEQIAQQQGSILSNLNTKENKQGDVLQTNENSLKEDVVTNSQKEEKTISKKPLQKNVSNDVVASRAKKENKYINTISPLKDNATNDILASDSPKSKTSNKERQKSRSENVNSTNTPSNKKENEIVFNKEVKNTASKQDQVTTKSAENKVMDTTHVSATTNNNVAKDTLLPVKDSVAKTKTDSIKPVAKETGQETKNESLKQATVFSIDAGANYALGWKYNTTKEAAGLNAIFGLSIAHYFTVKWSLFAGLQYNSLSHLSYSSYSGSNTQLGFGYTTSYTTITPKIIYYMAIPVKLQYHINKNNSISVGANILHLLNTSSAVSTYTQSDYTASNHATSNKMGYMDGISTWDIQPVLAYRRRIYKGYSVSAEAYYGLIDVKNNSFFGINKSEKNSGFKLVLSYSFVK